MSGTRRQRDWQKTDPHLRSHPAFVKFKRRLGCNATVAHGILAGLWAFAFDFAQDGDLSRFDAEDLATALEWDIDGAKVMKALEGSFVVRGVIHDWSEWGGALFSFRQKDAERKWDDRNVDKQGKVSKDIHGCPRMSKDILSLNSLSSSLSSSSSGSSVVEEDPGEVLIGEVLAEDLFESLFWPAWPNRHGSKKIAKARFAAAGSVEQRRILAAEGHLISTIADGRYDMDFLPRAENFVGGQKSFYEEWAEGPPAKYRGGNGKKRSAHEEQVDRLIREMGLDGEGTT